jgi:hypothetical protein
VEEVRNQFHQSSTGGFLREADQWTLITDTVSGALNVEHAWSYFDPFSHGKTDCLSLATVEDFLKSNADDSVKQKLRDALLSTSK